jgi:hypothetical protein
MCASFISGDTDVRDGKLRSTIEFTVTNIMINQNGPSSGGHFFLARTK